MAAQYELLSQLLKSGGRLDMGQELFTNPKHPRLKAFLSKML